LHETKDAVDFFDNPVTKQQRERQLELFAESIIRECCTALNPMLRDMISRGQGRELILQHFGIDPKEITTFMLDRSIAHLEKQLAEQKQGWVCPKCGIDRTKDVCPKGDSAVLTGDCPMTATAQKGVKE
jgi:hypothetical protein